MSGPWERLRPIDGWRRFAGEVGVIVLGVLIALIVQQVAQAVKDRSDAAGARASLRAEVAENIQSLDNRARVQPCIDRRLEEIGRLLARAAGGAPFSAPSWIGRPQYWLMTRTRHDAASQAGRLSLLDGEMQRNLAEAYGSFESIDRAEDREQAAWATLRGLESLPRLTAEDASRFREALQDARLQNWSVRVSYLQILDYAEPLGIRRLAGNGLGSRSVCLPITTPRAAALRITNSRYGEP